MTSFDVDLPLPREQTAATGDLMLKLLTGLLITAAAAMILISVSVTAGLSQADLLEMSAVALP
jgi:hypothetical protein